MGTGPGHALGLIVAGRLVAGFGVGFESAIVILYMSEIVSGWPPKPIPRLIRHPFRDLMS